MTSKYNAKRTQTTRTTPAIIDRQVQPKTAILKNVKDVVNQLTREIDVYEREKEVYQQKIKDLRKKMEGELANNNADTARITFVEMKKMENIYAKYHLEASQMRIRLAEITAATDTKNIEPTFQKLSDKLSQLNDVDAKSQNEQMMSRLYTQVDTMNNGIAENNKHLVVGSINDNTMDDEFAKMKTAILQEQQIADANAGRSSADMSPTRVTDDVDCYNLEQRMERLRMGYHGSIDNSVTAKFETISK